ncbi:hypothetical protein ACFIQG_10345 [Comamonas odontotermitis]|uniref:hypothetical protein n=1 Tax=Comamonas odontotermitis TaxID=379895 RepID=UPI00366E86B8
MLNYVVLDEKNVVVESIFYSTELTPTPQNYLLLKDGQKVGVGYVYKNGKFTPPPVAQKPAIVVESITADGEYNGHTIVSETLDEVRTIVGATLRITARIDVAGQLYPLNESFDLPISSVDGRVRPVRVVFENGRAIFNVAMPDARIWQVAEEMINSGLHPEKHMRFAGLRVVVAEV